MTKVIHVAAGVIENPQGEILIAKRADDAHQGGLWEFPGGKLETGEKAREALIRELEEEVGIVSTELAPLIQIRHNYPDKSVLLDVWRVTAFEGEAHGKEGQPIRWVTPSALDDFQFPAANTPIVAAAQLPSRYLITGEESSVETCLEKLQKSLNDGARLIQLRQKQWSDEQWQAAVPAAHELCRAAGAILMVNSPNDALTADGRHLTARQLMSGELPARSNSGRWIAASCHNASELERALELGVDFVTLSPVLPTESHPGQDGMGWDQFQELVANAKIPVFALGGMSDETLSKAVQSGAQGIAAIRAWWP